MSCVFSDEIHSEARSLEVYTTSIRIAMKSLAYQVQNGCHIRGSLEGIKNRP